MRTISWYLGAAMIMGVAPAHADPDWSRAKVVEVHLSSFAYTPATITLQHGTPYRLHLVNTSGGGHDFVAKEFFAQATLDPANRSIVDKGKVAVDGGESVDVDVVATRAGTYDVHCSHFMHSTFGMKGRIIVL